MRTVTTLAGILAAVTVSVTAASASQAGAVKQGGTFRVVAQGQVTTIDPALAQSFAEATVLRPACAGLLAYQDKPLPAGFRVEPDLAESQPVVSRDGKTYTFTIRKNARFSDGTYVTARNFVRSLERIFDPAMNSPQAPYFDAIVGAKEMLKGQATTLAGASAVGRTLTLRLTRRVADFPILLAGPVSVCAVPNNLPSDPEGARAPLASPAPYYVSQYVPGQQVVLERNRFYRGPRPHHVDRFTVSIGGDVTVFDQVVQNEMDYALGNPNYFADHAEDFAKRYGVNKSRFFVVPAPGVRTFVLNTSRPLFRDNVKLRQAVNFAVDRKALTRELGPYAGTVSDQFLPPTMPGYRDERIYPLNRSDLRRARALAKGRTRSGKAVLYTTDDSAVDAAQAQILSQNLAKIGLELEVERFPIEVLFQKLATPGEPFDIGRVSWGVPPDPAFIANLFDGRTIGQPGFENWSYFNSPKYNRLLARALKLPPGTARFRAFGELDVQISRDAAPAIAYGVTNQLTLVSQITGCVVVNPVLDLTAVCLK